MASCAALNKDDYVVGTYRDHGLAIAKGMPPKSVMAELFGKVTGCSKGLGGSMHLFDAENNMLGGYGIVGGHIPVAAGVAFASKYRGDKRVTLCFFGEGAVSIGGFHEALSLAALWKLPIVFICENNEYSMGTPLSRTMSVEDVSLKGIGYGMARDRIFVRDVLEFEQHVTEAVARARNESRSHAHRSADLSVPWPLHERSRQVPDSGRAGRTKEAQSLDARQGRARARRTRRPHRAHRGRCRTRDRRSSTLRRGEPGAERRSSRVDDLRRPFRQVVTHTLPSSHVAHVYPTIPGSTPTSHD